MMISSHFLNKIVTYSNKIQFKYTVGNILKTPPVKIGSDNFITLSMVHHRDVNPYLLSIKSFCLYFKPKKIVVVVDPTITSKDQKCIASHVAGVEFVPAEKFREEGIPQGGCWERLTAIADYVRNDYVVQLDADTVTLGELEEVKRAIEQNSSFVLATENDQKFISCREAALWAKTQLHEHSHVQVLAESYLDRLMGFGNKAMQYVRGCAGFSGFSAGSLDRSFLRQLSKEMGGSLGVKWSAWGTEQFASNFIISNSPSAKVLPHPKYCHPGREQPETVFLHFIGFVRFKTDRYAKAARETFQNINNTPQLDIVERVPPRC